MSDYSKVNLLEIDDSARDNKGVEARFARKHLDSRDLGVTLLRYAPNYRSAMAHSHKVQERRMSSLRVPVVSCLIRKLPN